MWTSRHILLVIAVLLCASFVVAQQAPQPGNASNTMLPFEEFARQRGQEPTALAAALGLPPATDLSQPVGKIMRDNGITPQVMQQAVGRADPIAAEGAAKNWSKIRLKFMLWVLFFIGAMLLLVRTKIRPRLRVAALIAAVMAFGVWLGVEPNAPGTIKDGLVLYGETGVIFPPRLIALIGFLLMGIIGNKVFCGWLCQFGTLQDLVSHVPTRKWKPPFWLSNTVRIIAALTIAVAAVAWGADLLEPVDPFRVFRLGAPLAVGVAVLMLVGGLFIWRPWCSFFCVFGLVSWLGERLSLARVRINHETCIDCHRCEKACGNHSMAQLRARKPLAQDCFACGACIRVCPVNALRWGLKPPADKGTGGSKR